MTRLEVHMEALILNDEEAEALKERVKCYRRKKAEISHQQILKNVAKHALSLTPPRSTSKPKIPSHLIPADPTSSSYMPRKVIYSNPQKSKQKNQQQKQQRQQSMIPKRQQQSKSSSPKNSMPVTMIGVMSHPKPLSPISSSPPASDSPPPLQNYNEWKKRQPKKNLPKAWKQTDTPPSGEDEEETKIELPESLQEREEMGDDAQKKNDNSERELIPVDPSRSFEKHYLFPTPPSSTTSSLSSTLPPPSRNSSSQYASNTDLSSYYTTTTDESYCSTKSRSSSQEALSPPFLIVPKTINALAANNIGKVYITDKLSDLDKLVLATAFSPVPVKQKPPKHAGKSKSDFAIHQKPTNRSPFKSLFKKSTKKSMKQSPTSPAAEETKFPSERNIDVCKQYEIVKAVRFPNKWLDEMEAIAIIVFLIAVIALLFYRSIIIDVV